MSSTNPMPEFALLFRPTRALSADELPRRNAAARDWALALQREGALSVASPLEGQAITVSQSGASPSPRDGAIASVLIVKAADLDAAVALAKGHPGLAFGTQIEVRPVKDVGGAAVRAGAR